MIRVLIVDDDPGTRMGLSLMLRGEPDIEVAGTAEDGARAVSTVDYLAQARTPVDVVVMDVRMPQLNGLDATRQLTARHPDVRVLVLTTFDRDDYAFGALRAGASGFLLKDADVDDLVAAVRSVARGDAVLSPRITREVIARADLVHLPEVAAPTISQRQLAARAAVDTLTPRERELLVAIGRGLTNAEIATELYLSPASVKTYVVRLLAKLDLRDRVQVVILAYDSGILDEP